MALSHDRVIRFGVFEANLAAHEFRKHGVRLRLGGQPFAILALLLEKPGQVITRDELRHQLWPSDTFVDFEQGLNGAVMKLRTALGDSPQSSRYIETLPRVGYRFVAPVSQPEPSGEGLSAAAPGPQNPGVTASADTLAQAQTKGRLFPWGNALLWFGATAVVILLAVAIFQHYYRGSFALGPKDTIVLADFQNSTGDSVFDDALRESLTISLQQSTLLQVLPERTTASLLKQMGRAPDERVTGQIALELCQRAGSKVAIQGSISSLGTGYLVGLAGIRCDTGEPILHEQVTAKNKDAVIAALGSATGNLRKGLGESLASIQKNDIPLTQATTSSLEALKAYTQALTIWDAQGDKASVPAFRKAVDLDPQFAMAYAALATEYYNLGDTTLARENATKAYDLRDRLTERERFSIEARYHNYVTGNKERSVQIILGWLANHPDSPGALANLSSLYATLGQNQKALEYSRTSLRLDPQRANTYTNLASMLIESGQIDEATAMLADAEKHNFQTDYLLLVRYRLAFLQKDAARMQDLVQQSQKVPGARPLLLDEQSKTSAYFGRLEESRQFVTQAVDALHKDADAASADGGLAEHALIEAEMGSTARAAEYLDKIKQSTASLDVHTLTALILAKTGHPREANDLCERLDKENPENTSLQGYWLPTIRAQVELQRGNWESAIRFLASVGSLENGGSNEALTVHTLYPAYVRGNAYLAGGDGAKAAAEFQKLLDHPGMVLNFPLGALARLGRARAFRLTQNAARARGSYEEFFALWKDADPNVPILRQAKTEYTQLH